MSKFPDPDGLRKAADGIDASNKASQEALEKANAAKAAQATADAKSAEAAKALAKVVPPTGGRGGNGNPRTPSVLGGNGGDDGVRKAILLGIAVLVLIAFVVWLAILTGTKANNSEVSAVKQLANTAQATANEAKADAKSAKEVANKAISEASEAKADAVSAMSTAKEAKTLAEICNCKRDCIRKASPPKPKAKTPAKPKPPAKPKAPPPKEKCADCIPKEKAIFQREVPAKVCGIAIQKSVADRTIIGHLQLDEDPSNSGKIRIARVNSFEGVATKVSVSSYPHSKMADGKGDCNVDQAIVYQHWPQVIRKFELPLECVPVRSRQNG